MSDISTTMIHKNVAFLLTCHNRKETTLNCVTTIQACSTLHNINLDIIIVDDNSTDGTTEAIKQLCFLNPNIYLVIADGSQYWGGGMTMAYEYLLNLNNSYDLLFFINDDILITTDQLHCFMQNSFFINSIDKSVAFTCATFKDQNDQISYGGVHLSSRMKTLKIVPSLDNFLQCDACNFNLVSIEPYTLHELGFIPWFTPHQRGDFYVSYKATKNKFKNFVAPGFYGICNRNHTLYDELSSKSKSLLSLILSLFSKKKYPLPHVLFYGYAMFGVKGIMIFAIKIIKDAFCIICFRR